MQKTKVYNNGLWKSGHSFGTAMILEHTLFRLFAWISCEYLNMQSPLVNK